MDFYRHLIMILVSLLVKIESKLLGCVDTVLGLEMSNGQLWSNRGKSKYPKGMGSMGLTLISKCMCLIFISWAAGWILKNGVRNWHVGPFGELSRAH
ncbi:hypothetical protein H5410_036049 [Solanum commersonii]|uniref:Uncharacterized protein n=1 Tax=Solanum commersonii TaxID=4109 RepID=A0A9J5Y316_SOLCO|nr:hypothetical protein H5410_036049 [Solanum commersonii]